MGDFYDLNKFLNLKTAQQSTLTCLLMDLMRQVFMTLKYS